MKEKANFRIYKNFTKKEFGCRCGCGVCNPSKKLLDMLQKARNLAKLHCHLIHEKDNSYPEDVPFIVERGSSCKKHNKSLKESSKTSSHIADNDKEISTAVDLKCNSSFERYIILRSLIEVGFVRIGFYNNHNGIHADCDDSKAQYQIWKT